MFVSKWFSILLYFVAIWDASESLTYDSYNEYQERQPVCDDENQPTYPFACQQNIQGLQIEKADENTRCEKLGIDLDIEYSYMSWDRHSNMSLEEDYYEFTLMTCGLLVNDDSRKFYALGSGEKQGDAYLFECDFEICHFKQNLPSALEFVGQLTKYIYDLYTRRQPVCDTENEPIYPFACQQNIQNLEIKKADENPSCVEMPIHFDEGQNNQSKKFTLMTCGWRDPNSEKIYALGSGEKEGEAYLFECSKEICNFKWNLPSGLKFAGISANDIYGSYAQRQPVCDGQNELTYPFACQLDIKGLKIKKAPYEEPSCVKKRIHFDDKRDDQPDKFVLMTCGWHDCKSTKYYALGSGKDQGDAYLFECSNEICYFKWNLRSGLNYVGNITTYIYETYARKQPVCKDGKPLFPKACERTSDLPEGTIIENTNPTCNKVRIAFGDGRHHRDNVFTLMFCGWRKNVDFKYALGSGKNTGDAYLFECGSDGICDAMENLNSALNDEQ